MKMCASSCVKARTRISPCSAPDGSKRCTLPNSASLKGRSRYDLSPFLKIWMWPGQFIGLMTKLRSSSSRGSVRNMLSRKVAMWPEATQSEESMSCGALTSAKPNSICRRRI